MEESKFQFKNPELVKLSFNINDNFDENMFNGINISSNTIIQQSNSENIAIVTLILSIGDNTSPFNIDVEMKSEFKWDLSFDDDTIKSLLRTNAPSFLLSYIRPIVSTITANSKYPAFNIPFINMSQNKSNEQE